MKSRTMQKKLEGLKKLYELYDHALKDIQTICKAKCSSCCTCNVTMTGLEAQYILMSLDEDEKKKMLLAVENHYPMKRYIPKSTTNGFARILMQGQEPTEEENNPEWGKCPLLKDDLCSIYDARPFGCRNLISEVECSTSGFAQIPPLTLTINNVFLQYIEHFDQNGIFGNLSDILKLFSGQKEQKSAKDFGEMIPNRSGRQNNFLKNEIITVLMVPPEHRALVQKLVEQMAKLFQDA